MPYTLIKKSYFSMLELVVVMGVFGILLLLTSIIFTAAQQAWIQSNSNVMTFENARIALDLMTRDIQSIYYSDNKIPFWYKSQSGTGQYSRESINFVSYTETPPANTKSNLCEVKYQLYFNNNLTRTNSGWLRRSATGDNSSKWNFYDNLTVGLTGGSNAFTANNNSNVGYQKLIPYVTNITFICYDETGNTIAGTTDSVVPLPFSIEINLSLLDKGSWQKWVAIDSNRAVESPEAIAFRKKHERTFQKTVYIGNRGQYN